MNVVVFDLETTGLSPERDFVVEIGALKVQNGEVLDSLRFDTLVKPTKPNGEVVSIPFRAQGVHGISDQMVRNSPTIEEVFPKFLEFVGSDAVVAHNIKFDSSFMQVCAARTGLSWNPAREICTLQLSRKAFPKERAHNLGVLAQRLGIEFDPESRHRSLGDVRITAKAYLALTSK